MAKPGMFTARKKQRVLHAPRQCTAVRFKQYNSYHRLIHHCKRGESDNEEMTTPIREIVYQTLRMSMVLYTPDDTEESIPKYSRHNLAENISSRSCTKRLDPRDTDTALCFFPSLSYLFADSMTNMRIG